MTSEPALNWDALCFDEDENDQDDTAFDGWSESFPEHLSLSPTTPIPPIKDSPSESNLQTPKQGEASGGTTEVDGNDDEVELQRNSKSILRLTNSQIRRRMYYLQLQRYIRRMEFRQNEVKANIAVNKANMARAAAGDSVSATCPVEATLNNEKELYDLESFEVAVFEELEMLSFRTHCLFGVEFVNQDRNEILPESAAMQCPVALDPKVVDKEETIYNKANYRRAKLCREFTQGPSYVGACVVELAKAVAAEKRASRHYAAFVMEEALKNAVSATEKHEVSPGPPQTPRSTAATASGSVSSSRCGESQIRQDARVASTVRVDSVDSEARTVFAKHASLDPQHEIFYAWVERLAMSDVVANMMRQHVQDVEAAGEEYHVRTRWKWNLRRTEAMAAAEKKAIMATWPDAYNGHRTTNNTSIGINI